MRLLPLDPAANASAEALRGFLEQCRQAAIYAGRDQLVSISMEVDALDPLAVLESIFEPAEKHFYVERPSEHLPSRTCKCTRIFINTLPNSISWRTHV